MTRRVWSWLLAAALLTGACSPAHQTARRPATGGVQEAPRVYAVIGGAETRGEGTDNPLREAWPQDLFRRLPANYTLVNVATPGATIAEARADELPLAESLHATLVTVWVNIEDILDGTTTGSYGAELGLVVHRIRATGATVLVANAPRLDQLPALLTCQDPINHPGPCPPFLQRPIPPPDAIRASVQGYNSAIDQVARAEGAQVVDLSQANLTAKPPSPQPSFVSDNGFDLNSTGQRYVADQFAKALGATSIKLATPVASP